MKYWKWITVVALAAPTVTATAYAQEESEESHPHETVRMEDLPPAVQTTLKREAQGKTIESIRKETENGATVYEAEVISNGKGQEVEISEAGKVLKREPAHEEKTESEHGESNR